MKTKRQLIKEKRQRKRRISQLLWGAIGLALILLIGGVLWLGLRPAAGEAIPVLPNSGHVSIDTVPGPYNSDPPTSGPHYSTPLKSGFYDEVDLNAIPENPEGYLVHNLEHGYVIFWYNYNLLDEQECNDLKGQIQATMDEHNGVKLIAMPRNSIDVPLVLTSWGRMQKFETFDSDSVNSFISRNRNRAPEPNAS